VREMRRNHEVFRNVQTYFFRIFWLLFCVVGVPIGCFLIPWQNIIIPIGVFWILAPIPFFYLTQWFIRKITVWRIYRLTSGIFYLYLVIFFFPLEFYSFHLYQNGTTFDEILFLSSIWLLVGVFLGILICVIPKKPILKFSHFSSSAVGSEKDAYELKESACNYGQGLLNFDKHVSVGFLNSDVGEGKSSFIRMMIESLDAADILYTYISLTETNDSRDFSRLFTERWFETLNERYPRFIENSAFNLESLSDILREHKEYAFFSGFFSGLGLKGIDRPLLSTKAKAFDPFVVKQSFVSDKIGQIFGGIPEIKEKSWIIVIDDFERSPIDEIYRVIEIVERFKIEGRTGLPVRLVFLLAFSGNKLKDLLNVKEKNKRSDKAFLIEQFLFLDSAKSSDFHIFVPMPSQRVRKEYILRNVKQLFLERN